LTGWGPLFWGLLAVSGHRVGFLLPVTGQAFATLLSALEALEEPEGVVVSEPSQGDNSGSSPEVEDPYVVVRDGIRRVHRRAVGDTGSFRMVLCTPVVVAAVDTPALEEEDTLEPISMEVP
jgi:hypothetical protein